MDIIHFVQCLIHVAPGLTQLLCKAPRRPARGLYIFGPLFDRCTSLSGFTRFLEFCILVHLCRIVCIIRCLSEQMCHFPGHAHSLMYRLQHVIAVRCSVSFHINSFYSSQLRDVFMYPTPDFEATSTPTTTCVNCLVLTRRLVFFASMALRFKASLYEQDAVV